MTGIYPLNLIETIDLEIIVIITTTVTTIIIIIIMDFHIKILNLEVR